MKRRSYRVWNGSEGFNQSLSNFSYSLYVIHYPLLLCFVSLIFNIVVVQVFIAGMHSYAGVG